MKERKRALQAKATVWLAPPPVSCLPALADPGPGPALTPAVFSCPLPQLSCPPSLLFLLSLSLLHPSISPLAESFSQSYSLDRQPHKFSLRLFFSILHSVSQTHHLLFLSSHLTQSQASISFYLSLRISHSARWCQCTLFCQKYLLIRLHTLSKG